MLDNLLPPKSGFDVVIDSDTFNEIDDQFAIAYLFSYKERCNILALHAAPFVNERASTAKEGMDKSYEEMQRLLSFMGNASYKEVYKGSEEFLQNETTPVDSEAARNLVKLANEHTHDNPLYVVAIACLTNVASAILMDKSIVDKIVLVWLGGNDTRFQERGEFNLNKDVLAARVVFKYAVNRFVQVPCLGVVSAFTTSGPEITYWLKGKNALCDFLLDRVLDFHKDITDRPWCKQIWDVVAVAWLFNDNRRFMLECVEPMPLLSTERYYQYSPNRGYMRYVYYINRDNLFGDLFSRLSNEKNYQIEA